MLQPTGIRATANNLLQKEWSKIKVFLYYSVEPYSSASAKITLFKNNWPNEYSTGVGFASPHPHTTLLNVNRNNTIESGFKTLG